MMRADAYSRDNFDLNLKFQLGNIRNRSQSDISDKRGRYTKKLYNREYPTNASRDEIDVAKTLANFNSIHINFKQPTRYELFSIRKLTPHSAEKQQHLNDLSKNPHSGIVFYQNDIEVD